MKKVFMIHENTKPTKIKGVFVTLATDFVVTVGWIKTEEKDSETIDEYTPIYMNETEHSLELNQYLPGVYFDTYEEGCRALVKILGIRTRNDVKILETYKRLAEQFPESIL